MREVILACVLCCKELRTAERIRGETREDRVVARVGGQAGEEEVDR